MQGNPCPVNPYTNVQWTYSPEVGNCRYPKIIPGRGDTGQQTDIVMSVDAANVYAQSIGNPRQLFLKPAKLLNNRSLTNMSDEAFAALVYAQVYVEEKWFKDYNWVHPYWNSNRDPEGGNWLSVNSLNAKRYAPIFLTSMNDWATSLMSDHMPYRLSGFGFGPGNELFGQAVDSAQWFLDYLHLSENRYGLQAHSFVFKSGSFLEVLDKFRQQSESSLLSTDVFTQLRDELLDVEQSQFWNTMRFLWAAARHREGAYKDTRATNEISKRAIDYRQLIATLPSGRPQIDVSVFGLITTVYSDTITVPDVTGYGSRYIGKDYRNLEDWKRFISERNKAIHIVELLANTNAEGSYRIQQALGIGPLNNQYANPDNADFLPYAREEVEDLINALLFESNNQEDKWVSDEALQILNNSKLLQEGYQYYDGRELKLVTETINGHVHYSLGN